MADRDELLTRHLQFRGGGRGGIGALCSVKKAKSLLLLAYDRKELNWERFVSFCPEN